MPELPEVETTRRGLHDYCVGQAVRSVTVRDRRLRWPVPEDLHDIVAGGKIHSLERRAKYLLFRFSHGTLLAHLGMSGSLRVLLGEEPAAKHDHIDITLDSGAVLRYNDPRRFGCFLWFPSGAPVSLLDHLGPEPLSPEFDGERLYTLSRRRKVAVKNFIMDGSTVVGVGNIYANESLFLAGIRPDRAANRVSRARYDRLADEIKSVLTNAIDVGGTTLRDFVGGDGKPGYFAQQLYVYGRGGEPCKCCAETLRDKVIGQRATVFCVACQR
ncbi:MAG: bifunctional DNA-formamidopyrimidine glycosylase/DNA-(apurinic or apyrimidinic site) lyase [Pseudomonadota bacterium]